MSASAKTLHSLRVKIRSLQKEERTQKHFLPKVWRWGSRWGLMLYHEFLRDEVKVRAESLTFLMIFSLLPLIAGTFFIFTIFAHFGFVQEALLRFVEQFLQTIPLEHREFVRDYVLNFKNEYLKSLSDKSGSIGIFALFILIWVGMQTFSNIDKMLNHIWGSERQRHFFEQLRNFLVVVVAAPLALVSGLSLPPILQQLPGTHYLFERVPLLWVLLNSVLTPGLIWSTFVMLYRYVPTRKVKWKSALIGALFSTICFSTANSLLGLYFKFGTQSAYGKAAIVPLIGFWIYVVWIIIILGAEVSFLIQNQKDLLHTDECDPSLKEGAALLAVLGSLKEALSEGKNPVSFEKLRNESELSSAKLHRILEFLLKKQIIVECLDLNSRSEGVFALAKEPKTIPLEKLLRDFYQTADELPNFDLEEIWRNQIDDWLKGFSHLTLASAGTTAPKRKKPTSQE